MAHDALGRFAAADLTGVHHDNLTAIGPTAKRDKIGNHLWKIRCDCGKTFVASAARFRRRQSCGCQSVHPGRFPIKDFTGVRVNDVEAIRPTNKRKHTYTVWVLKCLLCGEFFERAAYALTKETVAHLCPAWLEKYHPRIGREPLPDFQCHVNILHGKYRKRARVAGMSFELTRYQARRLFEAPCHYCGKPPGNGPTHQKCAGTYLWNGIDRLDSTQGYLESNCVACCKDCNWAKGMRSVEEFTAWISRVYRHLNARPS